MQYIIKNPPKFQHKNSGVVVDVGGLFFIWELERYSKDNDPKCS